MTVAACGPTTRTRSRFTSDWLAASTATPSLSWSPIVNAYRPGASGSAARIRQPSAVFFAGTGSTTSPRTSGTTRAKGSIGVTGSSVAPLASGEAAGSPDATGPAAGAEAAGADAAGAEALGAAAAAALAAGKAAAAGGDAAPPAAAAAASGGVTTGTSSGSQRTDIWRPSTSDLGAPAGRAIGSVMDRVAPATGRPLTAGRPTAACADASVGGGGGVGSAAGVEPPAVVVPLLLPVVFLPVVFLPDVPLPELTTDELETDPRITSERWKPGPEACAGSSM